jgi:hypothetical protein
MSGDRFQAGVVRLVDELAEQPEVSALYEERTEVAFAVLVAAARVYTDLLTEAGHPAGPLGGQRWMLTAEMALGAVMENLEALR